MTENAMIYVLTLLLAAACGLLASVCLSPERLRTVRLLRPKDEETEVFHKMENRTRRIASGVIGLIAALAAWRMFCLTEQTVDRVRFALALLCLTGSGCADWTEHRIPNIFPLTLTLGALCALAWECKLAPELASVRLINCLIAGGVSLLCLVLLSLLSQHGVGAGDIKLVSALGLLMGIRPLYWTVLLTMVLCAAGAAYLLITKKKTLKQAVAFGPFVLAGYCLAWICGLLAG